MKIEKVVIEKSCELKELNSGDMFLWTNISSDGLESLKKIQDHIVFDSVHILCNENQKTNIINKSLDERLAINVDSGIIIKIYCYERVIKVNLL